MMPLTDEKRPEQDEGQAAKRPDDGITLALNGMIIVGPFPRQAPLPGSGFISMPEDDQ
ncbi:hypothetical protein [Mesorhizobium sp. RIZ17]|uniref:hypothetical protein n=1 Tax=Mesorhizobium sp. RIZ17 TaxID=3132743 RepID=UPI003DAA0BFE